MTGIDGMTAPSRSPAARARDRFLRNGLAGISLLFLVLMGLGALMAPALEAWLGVDAFGADLFKAGQPPGGPHLLGTDEAGRDVLTRLLHGGRVTLIVALAAALASAVIGTFVGLMAGLGGSRWDAALMRLTDAVIALPILPILFILAALDLAKLGLPQSLAESQTAGVWRIVLIIALFGWPTVARLVRAQALSLIRRDFVRAARAMGASQTTIALRHLLPNLASPIIVATTLSVGNIILFESVLSFLGLGIDPPTPSWGNMLTNAEETIWSDPRLAIWPGVMIFLTVIAFNLLGDGLQDALDPRAEADQRL